MKAERREERISAREISVIKMIKTDRFTVKRCLHFVAQSESVQLRRVALVHGRPSSHARHHPDRRDSVAGELEFGLSGRGVARRDGRQSGVSRLHQERRGQRFLRADLLRGRLGGLDLDLRRLKQSDAALEAQQRE